VTPHTVFGAIANSFNPLLAILALVVPFVRRPRILRSTIAYYLSAGIAIGLVYLVRAIDDRYQVWASRGLDYSTHSAFAASLATSIAAFHRRWAAPLVLATVLYFALEIFMRYHGINDILASAGPAAIMAAVLLIASRRLSAPSA
jgi:acid phosphatase family membrane protein YuiD